MANQSDKSVENSTPMNPYPGLRPFQINESHLFFGREGQSDEVLQKLSDHRFVGIIGPSGSGKSSFVYCGVLPILFGGFLTNTGPNWDVIVLRPGSSPIENLAAALLEKDPNHSAEPEDDHEVRKTIITTLLRSNSNGLIEAIKQLKLATNMNYLILVDQFEELFRYKGSSENKHASDDSHTFINLLMQAVNAEDDAYYVSITMRSDFIGECAQFAELTSKINLSHFLIPQLTREQKRKAIEGPASVANGVVAKRLVNQLLNDLGENPDQLPILQHSMMRTWDYWINNQEGENTMDLKHYEAIGTMSEALSQHADEAYNDLEEDQKRICESMFKSITEKRGTFGIRRPTKLKEVADIAGCTNKELAEVIVTFRKPGRSFLTPMHGVKLNPESVIDISHESLMRIWIRLTNWVDEEAESVNMYLRLADAGEQYQIGNGGLWRPPNLQLALNWQVKNNPTLVWGHRYDSAFERTMSFLEYSKKEYDNEQKVKELQLKRKQRNQRITVGVLTTATLVSIGFLIFAMAKKTEADKNLVTANEQTAIAKKEKNAADSAKNDAEYQREIALEALDTAEAAKLRADFARTVAEAATDTAEFQRGKALDATKLAQERQKFAQEQQVLADKARENAQKNEKRAIASEEETKKERFNGLAKFLGSKATQNIPDPQLRGLLAKQGYNYNQQWNGKPYDSDISAGLYAALEVFGDPLSVNLPGHKKEIYSIKASPASNKIYSSGTLGRILEWDVDTELLASKIIVSARGSATIKGGQTANIKDMDVSPDGVWLVVAGIFGSSPEPDQTYLELYNLETGAKSNIPGVLKESSAVHFIKNGTEIAFIDNDGKRVNEVNRNGSSLRNVYSSNDEIKDMSTSPDGKIIAIGGSAGIKFLNSSDGSVIKTIPASSKEREIESLDYNEEGTLFAYGDSEGTLIIINTSDYQQVKRITDHENYVTDVDFNSDNGKSTFLSTSSLDNTVRVYNLKELNDPPITYEIPFTHIYSTEFTRNNEYIFVGAKIGIFKHYPIEASSMAEKICDYITREFTDDEWEAYIGKEVDKENTCNVVSSSN